MRRGGRATVAAWVSVAGLLAGCGDRGADEPPIDPAGPPAWRSSDDPVDAAPLVWEADGVVHLGDGTEIDLGGLPSAYVVAGDGVFFVPAADESEAETGSTSSAEVRFAAPGEESVGTGLELRADTLRASPDGTHLLGIDVDSGPEDSYGTPVAQLVVLDLAEGREVARTSDGLGDTSGDLADLYEDAGIGVGGVTDTTAYVDGVDGPFAVDLATGEVADAEDPTPQPGSPQSPDGSWSLRQTDDGRTEVRGRDGEVVPLDTGVPRWTLDWWADADTVVGVAIVDDETSALLSCVVPDGTCEVHEDSIGATVRFADGAAAQPVVELLRPGG